MSPEERKGFFHLLTNLEVYLTFDDNSYNKDNIWEEYINFDFKTGVYQPRIDLRYFWGLDTIPLRRVRADDKITFNFILSLEGLNSRKEFVKTKRFYEKMDGLVREDIFNLGSELEHRELYDRKGKSFIDFLGWLSYVKVFLSIVVVYYGKSLIENEELQHLSVEQRWINT